MMKNRLVIAWLVVSVVALMLAVKWWSGRYERSLSRAAVAVEAQDWDEAMDCLGFAESNPKTHDRAIFLKARALLEMGRPREAVAPLNTVDPHGPNEAEAAFWKGRTLYAAGQSYLSIPWFQVASTKKPNDPEMFRWLAVAAYEHGATSIAVSALESVTRLQPNDARAWRTLAMIHKDYARFEQARDAYRQIVRLDFNDRKARLEYVECLVKLGAYGEAKTELAGRKTSGDVAHERYLLACCLQGLGETEEFEANVPKWAVAFPSHAGLHSLASTVELRKGDFSMASFDINRAIHSDPYQAEFYYRRSQLLRRIGDHDQAEADRRKAFVSVFLVTAAGWSAAEIAKLDEMASQKPGDAAIRCELGRHFIILGRLPLASSWYRAALACDPASLEAREGLETVNHLANQAKRVSPEEGFGQSGGVTSLPERLKSGRGGFIQVR